MSTTLLGTKLHIPPLGRACVPRQRLISQLESGLGAKLTLVLAPAGFGKTTLVASWIRSWQEAPSPAPASIGCSRLRRQPKVDSLLPFFVATQNRAGVC